MWQQSWLTAPLRLLPFDFLFGETRRFPTEATTTFAEKKHDWPTWRTELLHTPVLNAPHIVLSGFGPAALWMQLGYHYLQRVRRSGTGFTVVNIHPTTQAAQVLPISFTGFDRLLAATTHGQPNTRGVLYVCTDSSLISTPGLDELFPSHWLWTLHPSAGKLLVTAENLPHLANQIQTTLQDMWLAGVRQFALATSSVNAIAFVMGASCSPNLMADIQLLHFDGEKYVLAGEI